MPSLDNAIGEVTADPLDAAIDGVTQDNARLRTSLYGATKQNPDEVARATQLARQTGLPTPIVQRNLQTVQQRATLDSLDAAIEKGSAVDRKLSDAEFAAMAHDDVGTLSGVEALLKPPAVPTLTPDYGFGQASQDLRREQDTQRAKLDAFFSPRSTVAPSRGPAPSFSSIASGLGESFAQGAERATQGVRMQFADTFGLDEMAADAIKKRDRAQFRQDLTTPEFESSTGAGLYGGGASLLQNLPGMIASIITRNPAPALAAAGLQTELDAYGRYRSRGATPGEAALGAGGEGLVEVGTEMIPLRTMLGAFGKPGSTAAKEFLKSQVQEQFGEQVATVLQDALDTAIANPNKTWGQYLAERPDAAYQTALATLVTSGAMTAGHVAISKMAGEGARADAAARDAEVLAKMAQLAKASKLRARDPKTFQDFIETANENGPVQDIYLDARTLQQSGVDVAALAQASPAVAAQMQEAAATGGDIVIPMAEYAAKIAGTDLDAALVPHLRTSEEALSLDEAQRFYQGQTDQFKQAAAQAMEEHATDETFKASAKEVETKLFDDLKQTGRFTDDVNKAYATLGRDFYVATAARLGITPTEMFSRYPLKMAVDRITGGQRMEQGSAEENIRTAFEAVPSVSLGTAYPITVEFNGRKQQFMARQDALKGRNARAALHLTHLKRGRMVAGGAEQWIAQEYKLDSKNNLKPNGMPKPLSDEEAAQFRANFPEALAQSPALNQSPKPNLAQRVMQAVTNALGVTQAQPEAPADDGVAPLDMGQFFQGQGNRAEISFAKDITSQPSVITLFKNADLSSFLHEMGHFQLEVLAHIASQPNAPAEIVQDLDAVFKWFGITGSEQPAGGETAGALGQGAVESDAFKAWFGDSKVVDANGKPLVVYHGAAQGFTAFDPKRVGVRDPGFFGSGFYFTPDEDTAQGYADSAAEDAGTDISGSVVMPAFVSLKNPFVWDMADTGADATRRALAFAGVERQNVRGDSAGLGNPKEREAFNRRVRDAGHDGVIVRDEDGIREVVAFSPEQIKSAVGNSGAFDPNDPNILNQGDDTTPKPTSLPPGRTPLEVWQAMSLEEKRPYHEQFARGFEAYLFEGKAPSAELSGVFARFRAWLVNVYKSVKALNVEINDEIRGVFDRLVATDEAIKQAEAARSMMPLFKSAEEMGDAELWAAYQRTGAQATEDAVSDLQRRGLRDMQWLNNARGRILKQLQADAKAKRQAVEDEVKAEVRAMPVYAVQRFLRYGELPEANRTNAQRRALDATAGMPAKLDLGALKEMYGEGTAAPWRYLPTGKHGLAASEGVHPDLVAQVFGFTSGDQLVRDLLAATPEAEVIEGLTDQRVLERYGDLANPDTLARAADEAVHNEARARFVATELKALSKATGPVRAIAKAARDFAEATLARKKVKDIKPRQHAAAETRAAKAAEKAMAAGDTAAAAVEKRNQLVQNYSTRAAYDALDEVGKAVKYLKKFDSEGTRKNLDPDYVEQIDAMLERFDLRASVSNKDAAKRAKLAEWITAQEAQGFEPIINTALRDEAFRTPYRELSLEELRGLVDAVKNIEHLGRLKKKLLTAADQRDFDAAVGDVVGSIKENAKGSIAPQRSSDRSLVVKVKALFRHAAAIHRKFASLVREFDGFKDGGKAWEYLVRNMNDRGNFEAVENEKATVHLASLLDTIKHVKLREKQYFESIGRSYSREERIGIALNMGNETNTERVLTGERLSPAQLQEVLDTLSKEETDFVQGVWDFIASYKPQMAEKERRLTGVEPQWVEPTPWVTKHGTYPGGYYPIAYDPLLDERSSADINAEVQRQLERGLYVRAQTRRGHLKARSDSTGRPLRFDFGDVITRHVTQVVHDLAWHEYLIDANRLLRDPAIQQAIREHYGPEVYTELKDTLKDIAVGSAGTEKGAKFFNHLRYGTTIASLGFNVFNTLQNLTGITQSFSRVGTGWMLKGAVHWAGDAASMESSAKKIHAKSDFMRLRSKTMLREINDIRNKISGDTGKLQAVYFWLQNKTQLMVDVPTWWGAYEKAMAEDDMTESKAVALADQAVIDAQGSGQIKDLAGIQRGSSGLKLLTTFYSFFNTTFNLTAEAYGRTDFKKPGDVALFTADMVLLYALPALLSTLLKAALRDDWDDPEALARKMAGDQVSFLMGTVVGLREMAAGAQAAAGVGEGFGYSGPASLRFFSDFYNLGTQIHQGELDEAFWKSLNNEMGVIFHYPAGQINRTATGIAALLDGRTDNPAAVVMGAPPKQ